MKLKEKLKKTRRRSLLSYLVIFLVVVYFLMTIVKGLYLWVGGSNASIALSIHYAMSWVINSTWIFPISSLWQSIPAVSFEGGRVLEFYKVIVPPMVVIGICALFISDHMMLRDKFYELKSEIEKEINSRDEKRGWFGNRCGECDCRCCYQQRNQQRPLVA